MKKTTSLALLCLAPALALSLPAPAHADGNSRSTLFPGEYLFPGQRIVSDACYYHFDMQYDGNLVLYSDPGTSHPRWNANTHLYQRNGFWDQGQYATLQSDGNLVVYGSVLGALWATSWDRSGYGFGANNHLWVQNDGNLVMYDTTNSPWVLPSPVVWASGTNGARFGQAPCSMTTSVTVVVQNTNYYGADYNSYPTNRPIECAHSCAADGRCASFSWVPPGAGAANGLCWLKSSIPASNFAAGMTSGYIRH
jgi:hypothetical protein